MPVEGCSARKSVTRCTGATKSPPPCCAAVLQRQRGHWYAAASKGIKAAASEQQPCQAEQTHVRKIVIACTSLKDSVLVEQDSKLLIIEASCSRYLSMLRCSSMPARGELPRWAQSDGCTVTTRAALAHNELRRLQQQGGAAQHMQGHDAAVPAAWHIQGLLATGPAAVRPAETPDFCWHGCVVGLACRSDEGPGGE